MIRESVIQDQIQEISAKSLATNRMQIVFILVIATLFSGWDYIKNGKDLLKD